MLKVNNIFESISGEAGGFPQGTWTTFIRLQGCNLLCAWPCDTLQAQEESGLCYEMEIPSILKMIRNKHILLTGGEPLLQRETPELIKELLHCGHHVQVETNGSLEIPTIPNSLWPSVHWIVDRKCPSSRMEKRMLPLEIFHKQIRRVQDTGGEVYIKWVISNEEDIDFMIEEMEKITHYYETVVPFIISPVDAKGGMITSIVEKIWEKNHILFNHIIFSVQLHKMFKMP